MLCGRLEPGLGGQARLSRHHRRQLLLREPVEAGGGTIPLGHHQYRPLADLLAGVHARYGRPILLAETGAEGSGRAAWLFYVAREIAHGAAAGVPVEGMCLYPVLDYPGWDDDRHCAVGLFSNADAEGRRDRPRAPGR